MYVQIVKEYERAVILRLGRLVSKKAKGPGILDLHNITCTIVPERYTFLCILNIHTGLFFVLPCIDDVHVVNLRTVTFDVPPQEVSKYLHTRTHTGHFCILSLNCLSLCVQVLTKDSVTCRVDAVVYFRISDPIKSVISVENAFNSTYLRAQTTLRSILGTKNLKDILSERDIIRDQMSVSKPLQLVSIISERVFRLYRRCLTKPLTHGV